MKCMFRVIPFVLLGLLCTTQAPAQRNKKKDYLVTLATEAGTMHLILFDQTPLHKANFIKLAQEKFYDGLLFHRIIESFMIQGGDPNSRNAEQGIPLGNGSTGYRVPAEFRPELFHRKGALAAARDNNPEKASSGCQFYIVQGKKWSDGELEKQLERGKQTDSAPRKPTEEQRKVYLNEGGSPHLDGNYTVFGQVIDGISVIDALAASPRDERNRPLKNIPMQVSVELVKKKKISKKYGYTFN